MTTYNTGNPLGSKDPRDLYDNAENLDEAVNNTVSDFWRDRMGRARLTWEAIAKAGTGDTGVAIDAANRAVGAAGQAENEADRAASAASRAENAEAVVDATNIQNYVAQAETARDAAFVNADVFPSRTEGNAATVEGEQFQVVSAANPTEIIRYRRTATGSVEVARYPRGGFSIANARIYARDSSIKVNSSAKTITFERNVGIAVGTKIVRTSGVKVLNYAAAVSASVRLFYDPTSDSFGFRDPGQAFPSDAAVFGYIRVASGRLSGAGIGAYELDGVRVTAGERNLPITGRLYGGTDSVVVDTDSKTISISGSPRVVASTGGSFTVPNQQISYENAAGSRPLYLVANAATRDISLEPSSLFDSSTSANDNFLGSMYVVLGQMVPEEGVIWGLDLRGKGGGRSVSYTLALDTRTELADFNFAGNVIHHGSMRVVLDGLSRLVPEQDIALNESRSRNQTRAVVLNPYTLELSTVLAKSVTPSSGVVLYYYNENKREVHTIYPYRIDGTLVKPENVESGLATTGTVIFNDAEPPQLVIVDDSHTLEDPMPLSGAFTDSTLTSSTVYGWYDQLVDDFPQYVTRELMGMDASGVYPIYGYRFTPSLARTSSNGYTPRVFMCAIHSETLNFVYQHVLMREICRSWDDNPRLAALRFGAEFLVMPCANPYGLDGKQRPNANGVDINRNFPNGWILNEPNTSYYSGPSPASEVETQTIINAIDDFRPHVALDCHAFHGGEDRFVWTPIVDPTYRIVTQTACLQVYQKIVKQFPELEDRTFNSFYNPTETGSDSGGLMSKFFLASGAIGGTFEVSRNSVGGIYLTNEEIVTGASVLMNTIYEGIKTYKLYGAPRTIPQGAP